MFRTQQCGSEKEARLSWIMGLNLQLTFKRTIGTYYQIISSEYALTPTH